MEKEIFVFTIKELEKGEKKGNQVSPVFFTLTFILKCMQIRVKNLKNSYDLIFKQFCIKKCIFWYFSDEKFLKNGSLFLNVYFLKQTYVIYSRDTITSTIYLLCK